MDRRFSSPEEMSLVHSLHTARFSNLTLLFWDVVCAFCVVVITLLLGNPSKDSAYNLMSNLIVRSPKEGMFFIAQN